MQAVIHPQPPLVLSRLRLVSPKLFHVFETKASIGKSITLLDDLGVQKSPLQEIDQDSPIFVPVAYMGIGLVGFEPDLFPVHQ